MLLLLLLQLQLGLQHVCKTWRRLPPLLLIDEWATCPARWLGGVLAEWRSLKCHMLCCGDCLKPWPCGTLGGFCQAVAEEGFTRQAAVSLLPY